MGAHLSGTGLKSQDARSGAPMLHPPGRSSGPQARGVVYGKTVPQSLLTADVVFLSIAPCVVVTQPEVSFFKEETVPCVGIGFSTSMRRGEFRISLPCHLELEPSEFVLF